MFCKLIGQNDQDDTYQALENTCGCTYCIISLADAPFQISIVWENFCINPFPNRY